jgi:hypothetical protein
VWPALPARDTLATKPTRKRCRARLLREQPGPLGFVRQCWVARRDLAGNARKESEEVGDDGGKIRPKEENEDKN